MHRIKVGKESTNANHTCHEGEDLDGQNKGPVSSLMLLGVLPTAVPPKQHKLNGAAAQSGPARNEQTPAGNAGRVGGMVWFREGDPPGKKGAKGAAVGSA